MRVFVDKKTKKRAPTGLSCFSSDGIHFFGPAAAVVSSVAPNSPIHRVLLLRDLGGGGSAMAKASKDVSVAASRSRKATSKYMCRIVLR